MVVTDVRVSVLDLQVIVCILIVLYVTMLCAKSSKCKELTSVNSICSCLELLFIVFTFMRETMYCYFYCPTFVSEFF
jgi:hypothetical protein